MKMRKRDDLYKLINQMDLKGYAIEIGVALGKFSDIWIPKCNFEKVFLVDPWKNYDNNVYMDKNNKNQEEQDKRYNMVLNKAKRYKKEYGKNVDVIRKESYKSSLCFDDNFFDFIYIDANHDYKWIKEDLNCWYSKLKTGGIFAGHDYLNKEDVGVKKAVDEFCEILNKKISIVGKNRNCPSWYFVK